MITLQNVSKVYPGQRGDVRALDDLSMDVARGEFVAVRGPSGSGKSTLLMAIGGMSRPTDGAVTVSGTDIYSLSSAGRAAFRARTVGFVFQMFHLAPYLTVLENVCLPSGLVPGTGGRDRARELLERFGLSERLYHRPSELSTGERQRTAIARALINSPELLLADEPTGNLDPDTGAEILGYLAEFNREGGTVLLVTHEAWVETYAGRTVHLSKGCLTAQAPSG